MRRGGALPRGQGAASWSTALARADEGRPRSELQFEEAARVRDQLFAIERSLERQKIATTEPIDQDVFGFYREADRLLIYVLYVRQGRLTGGQASPSPARSSPTRSCSRSFVNLYYDAGQLRARGGAAAARARGAGGARASCSPSARASGSGCSCRSAARRRDLVEMARRTPSRRFAERKRSQDETEAVLERLQERLHLRQLPRRMECFDISHFQGATHRRLARWRSPTASSTRRATAASRSRRVGAAGRLRQHVRGDHPAAASAGSRTAICRT